MTLRPTDVLQIQSAIDEYEKRYPRRPTPTAEQALAWRLGKRAVAKLGLHIRSHRAKSQTKLEKFLEEPETRRIKIGWFVLRVPYLKPVLSEDLLPVAKSVLRLGWWSGVALGTASVFVLGAFVGGFK